MLRVLAIAGALGAIAAGCAKPPEEPLQLDGGRLTVQNASADDWVDVEIWLNQHYRVTWPRLEAGGRLIVPLDTFVAGFGQRFNFSRQQVTALRLEAKNTDGAPVEIHKKFQKGGLAGALEGMR